MLYVIIKKKKNFYLNYKKLIDIFKYSVYVKFKNL